MSGFSADWLALREPADAAARARLLTQRVAAQLHAHDALSVLDLGGGTGSNVRFLADQISASQQWLVVDHDEALLARVPQHVGRARVATRRDDLGTCVDDPHLYDGRHLVTASALLDLVSESWLASLAAQCTDHHVAVLFALTYDGRIECSPHDDDDEHVRRLVNRHQRIDKGFGPALGPDAARTAERLFAAAGYDVHTATSDWQLTPASAELQRQLVDGWAHAAVDIAPEDAAVLRAWQARRRAHIDAARSHLVVGHIDLAAWPRRV